MSYYEVPADVLEDADECVAVGDARGGGRRREEIPESREEKVPEEINVSTYTSALQPV